MSIRLLDGDQVPLGKIKIFFQRKLIPIHITFADVPTINSQITEYGTVRDGFQIVSKPSFVVRYYSLLYALGVCSWLNLCMNYESFIRRQGYAKLSGCSFSLVRKVCTLRSNPHKIIIIARVDPDCLLNRLANVNIVLAAESVHDDRE